MAYTFDSNLVSDLHKDAFGYRPSAEFMDMWNNGLSDEGRQAEWDYMVRCMKQEIEDDMIREHYAVEEFENELELIMNEHKINEETALRWMTQNVRIENSQDIEHWVWGLGILFTERGKEIVEILKTIHTNKQ